MYDNEDNRELFNTLLLFWVTENVMSKQQIYIAIIAYVLIMFIYKRMNGRY